MRTKLVDYCVFPNIVPSIARASFRDTNIYKIFDIIVLYLGLSQLLSQDKDKWQNKGKYWPIHIKDKSL